MKNHLQLTVSEQKPGRREFFKRFATGAVGLAASPLHGNQPGTLSDPECKVSAADSLMFYFQLITRVHSELDRAVAKPYEEKLKRTESMFNRLLKEIGVLEDELSKSKIRAQARQMRDLAELGRSNAQLLRASTTSKNRLLLSGDPLGVVAAQVCTLAQELLPTARVTLRGAATEALRNILCIVHEQETQRQAEPLPKEGLIVELNYIQREILAVMDALWAGAEAAAKADFRGQDSAALRIRAQDQIGKAISMLQGLKAKYDLELRNLASTEPRGSLSIDMLIDILTGAKKWVGDPSLLPVTAQSYRSEGAEFRTIANWSEASPESLWSRIGGALSNSCEADTWLRRAWCLSLIGPILIQHSDPGDRQSRIERVLDLFRCPYSGSMAGLAYLLARL